MSDLLDLQFSEPLDASWEHRKRVEAEQRIAELEAELAQMEMHRDAEAKGFAAAIERKDHVIELISNPMLWDTELNDAWHKNIPDVKKAFQALRDIAQAKAKEEKDDGTRQA